MRTAVAERTSKVAQGRAGACPFVWSGATAYIARMRAKGTGSDSYARIYAVIRRIPRGRVATYGQVADLAGLPGHARQVGYALHALPSATAVPWHRVINAAGGVSLRSSPGADLTQRQLLEDEGIEFDLRGRVRLAKVKWNGKRRAPPARPRRRPVKRGRKS